LALLEETVILYPQMVRAGRTVLQLHATLVILFYLHAFKSADMLVIATKLSFVMSQYYEANKRNAQACSFGGNGTVNSKASTASASSVASSCLASATGTNVPAAPSSVSNAGSASTSASKGKGKSGATTTVDSRALLGVFLMVVVSVAGGFLSLA
jgi:1,3-beta-glucanosyltransferase GAS1